MDHELIAYVREAFGWDTDVAVSAGRRGALGQIWRLDVGPARYALKEIFGEPPPGAVVEAELAFARRAAGAGVRLPASHPDREGRHLLAGPGGRWLRLYDWADLRPADLAAPATPRELGTLLARLHRCAPATAAEPGGRGGGAAVQPGEERAEVARRGGGGGGGGGGTRPPRQGPPPPPRARAQGGGPAGAG
ncbi:hypothetical protein, partial [Nonomuraea sp. SBT364]|uniref:hypothetical protein n=1 Tax=Nonomuraea sp. SBT364 TaxID=1580530 RepID=UPI0018CE4BCC